jgi:uncharacterized membrane protein YgdD (TMEM256/DUF423 family)
MNMTAARIHITIAALFGACGIALWAAATHSGATSAIIGAQMLLMHAAAIPALTAVRKADLIHDTIIRHAISALILGVALFSGDLIARGLGGMRLFPMASPIGGVVMMISWVAVALAAMIGPRR